MTKLIYRFAPSPNGFLHLGHAYSALFTWAQAEKSGGEVLLRIEDIDIGRCRRRFTDQIYDDLKWLGLSWPEPVRVQSRHFDDYIKAAIKFEKQGLLYPCFCSRKEIAAAVTGAKDPEGANKYPGTCKNLTTDEIAARKNQGQPFAMRLDMKKAIAVTRYDGTNYGPLIEWGDVIIVRKDIPTSYHLSVVVDDAIQKITHITRGMDMFAVTPIHILLQKLLDLPTPNYQHHKLIENETGDKLSKSAGDNSLKSLREQGVSPQLITETVFNTQ